jgi:Domain of unknown function (DUF4123)
MEPVRHQLQSMLWSSPQARVHAIINGRVVPGLAQRLEKADVQGWQCLRPGALPPDEMAAAPYVAELKPDADFTRWLLSEAWAIHPGWGVVAVGPLNLLRMREHARRLLKVGLPDGSDSPWLWYDPALWEGLLPRLDGDQLMRVYGDLTDWVVTTPTEWRWHTLNAGRLVQNARACKSD